MPADTDRNLLFGVLALQAGLLDSSQFAEVSHSRWAAQDIPLEDLLVERGLSDTLKTNPTSTTCSNEKSRNIRATLSQAWRP